MCSECSQPIASPRFRAVVPWLAFVALLVLSGYRFYRLRHYQDFTDENDYVATGWLLSQGEVLYGSVFSHHMPFAYALTHLVAVISPAGGIAHYRLVMWLLYAALASAIFTSPLCRNRREGLVAASVFLGSASLLVPLFKGHMLLADGVWGCLFAIFFVQAFAPFLVGCALRPSHAALGGGAAALALCSALVAVYPIALGLGACVVLAAISPPHRVPLSRVAGPFLISLAGSGLAVLLWLSRFGDLPGFFEEAYFFNSEIYARLFPDKATPLRMAGSTFSDWAAYAGSAFKESFWARPDTGFVLLSAVAVSSSILAIAHRFVSTRVLLVGAATVVLALVFTRMRGPDARALSFYILVLCLLGLSAGILLGARSRLVGIASIASLGLVTGATALRDPSLRADPPALSQVVPADVVPAAIYVDEHTPVSERVAAFNATPGFYFLARRRPAVDGTYYLPWQAWWEESFPRVPDTLEQLRRNRPRFVYLFPWNVWDLFPWETYGREIDRYIKRAYRPVEPERFGGHLWERIEP